MKLQTNDLFMMVSNSFLLLPAGFAAMYQEWLYCFFAIGIFIFSTLFHWYWITKPTSPLFQIFRTFDWIFAVSSFGYMYYYVYRYMQNPSQSFLYIALTLVIIFFWYGWRYGDYKKLHPRFHGVASIVSSLILLLAN